MFVCFSSEGLLPNPAPNLTTAEPTNITFDHSDLTITSNSTNTTNQTTHQHITNHGQTNQQNFTEQNIHGNQSNLTPNFNTVIQSTNQPFVQNNSNTLVQNNTNLIQPINLVNFNNVSLDSIQSFFASQNNVVYLPNSTTPSSTTTTTTAATTTMSTTAAAEPTTNSSAKELRPSNIPSLLNPSPIDHQVSIRPKPSLLHPNQELVPVIPKMKAEHYESITRQYSSTNNESLNNLDNDSNDPKQKYPRPIRPKPSSRGHSLQTYKPAVVNESKSTSFVSNNSSPTVSLFSSPSYSSSPSTTTTTTNYVSQSSIEISTDQHPHLIHSKSLDLSVPPSTTSKKPTKKDRPRPTKKSTTSNNLILPSNNQTRVPIAPNHLGRPLAPAPSNIQRSVTSNNPITKRTTKKPVKRSSKTTLVQSYSENILQQTSSSPTNSSFAESISGFLENFDQELIASNFLSQTSTTNIHIEETQSIISSNTNFIEQNHEQFQFNPQSENLLSQQQDFNAEQEQITSFMSEEDMQLVEMNFDENTFLKQFDLDDPNIKLNTNAEQNLFAHILTNNNNNNNTNTNNNESIQTQQAALNQNSLLSLAASGPPPVYPGSSLINNNVFTTVVPLGSQQERASSSMITIVNNSTRLLPEEGVQLTARHIEPSQVATYESAKYQDILDDLVMVTDQEVLRHVQVTAGNDTTDVLTTDFSLALLEATNEIMKNANIQIADENSAAAAAAFQDLQYFLPLEQEQIVQQEQEQPPPPQAQIETENPSDENILHHKKQPIVILEKLESQILASVGIHRESSDENLSQTSITDLSSILQFQSIQSPIQHQTSTTVDLITPSRPTTTVPSKSPVQQIDYDSLLPPLETNQSDTQISSSNHEQSTKPPCILFEPISSSSNPSSPRNEMIIDSGRVDDISMERTDDNLVNDNDLEELLNDPKDKPYEIIENQGQTLIQNHVHVDDVDQLIDQIETTDTNSKRTDLLEHTFSRYQEKYHLNQQRQQEVMESNADEQFLTVPPVKLKLNTIYVNTSSKKNKRRKSISPLTSPNQQIDEHSQSPVPILDVPLPRPPEPIEPPPPVDRPPLKIKIRTKLPPPPPAPVPSPPRISSKEKTPNKKTQKTKKKKIQHPNQQQKKTKTTSEQIDTEYAGLTRFERPLAQMYRQQSPPTPDDLLPKDEKTNSPILLSVSSHPPSSSSCQNEPQPSTTLHSGFIIDEQTPPSSITSIEHKQSPPPLLNQTTNEQLRQNHSHLFNYDNANHQNNNTFITPPPETEIIHQKTNSYETYCTYTVNSPEKRKHHHHHQQQQQQQQQRKLSVASSSSSKSIPNIDYSLDTQALEPVSPTPISTASSKSKHSHSSTSSVDHNDVVPLYYDQPPKQLKDHQSRKSTSSSSSSSSHRSSRPASTSSTSTMATTTTAAAACASQAYSQSRSLSNHNYRTGQENPLIPPILPPQHPSMHLDPYSQAYHHHHHHNPFVPPTGNPAPFFNFPFSHPFLNPHSTPNPSHFHHPSMKYHHHHHPSAAAAPPPPPIHGHPHSHHHHHSYPTHQQQYPYHSHLQRQQSYNNSNYMCKSNSINSFRFFQNRFLFFIIEFQLLVIIIHLIDSIFKFPFVFKTYMQIIDSNRYLLV